MHAIHYNSLYFFDSFLMIPSYLLDQYPPDLGRLCLGNSDTEQAVLQTGPHAGGIDALWEAEGALKGALKAPLITVGLGLLCWCFGLGLLLGSSLGVGGGLVGSLALAFGLG